MGVSNKYTKQPPISGASTAVVLAERVYVAPSGTIYTAPVARLNGADPASPWVDMGVVKDSKVDLSYTKEIKYVETGIEKVRRGAYSLAKTAEVKFMLEQFDIETVEQLTGLTAQAVGAIGEVLHIGQDDIVDVAFLFIGVNKVDNKEHHVYSAQGTISYNIEQQDDRRILSCSASLYPFVSSGETEEGYYDWYVLD